MRPEEFYRFRNWPSQGRNYTRDLLQEGAFYCSAPRDFDDPHDSQLGAYATGSSLDFDRWGLHDMSGIPALMRKHKLSSLTQLSDSSITDVEDRRALTDIARRDARRNARALCLSADWSSELMWAFYADHHRGVCLCFDAQHDFFRAARPVLYARSPGDVEPLTSSPYEVDQLVYCKSQAWQFQKEWRIVFPPNSANKVPFPRESLRAVILGCRFPEILFEELKQVFIAGGYRVRLFRAERIPNRYELDLQNKGTIGR